MTRHIKQVFNRLAPVLGRHRRLAAAVLAVPVLALPQLSRAPELQLDLPPRPVATQQSEAQLAALRAKALTGSNTELAAYLRADLETYWPQHHGRVVVMQGNGPAATNWSEYLSGFITSWALATNTMDNARLAEVVRPAQAAFTLLQDGNSSGSFLAHAVGVGNVWVPVIAIPLSACRACMNQHLPADVQTCAPLHPDTPYYYGMYRLRDMFHEQAHALRMLERSFEWKSDTQKHREELIAELYADARLVQVKGDAGLAVVKRGQAILQVQSGRSRHYYAVSGRDMLLRWIEKNRPQLAHKHPSELLALVTGFAEKTLLPAATLKQLALGESQYGLMHLNAAQRLELAGTRAIEGSNDVRDAKGCRWTYPPALREIDRLNMGRGVLPGGIFKEVLRYNPLRSPALASADPFAIDKREAAQVSEIIVFNIARRPAACPALTAQDVQAADLWLPAKQFGIARKAGQGGAAVAPPCPQ